MEELFNQLFDLLTAGATDRAVQLTSLSLLLIGTGIWHACKFTVRRLAAARHARLERRQELERARARREEEDAQPTQIGREVLTELRYPTRPPQIEDGVLVAPGKVRVSLKDNRVWVAFGRDGKGKDVWKEYTERMKPWERKLIGTMSSERYATLEANEREAEESLALETLRRDRKNNKLCRLPDEPQGELI